MIDITTPTVNVYDKLRIVVEGCQQKALSPDEFVQAILEQLKNVTPEMTEAAYLGNAPVASYRKVIAEIESQRNLPRTIFHHPV